jgi:hypothetical protein
VLKCAETLSNLVNITQIQVSKVSPMLHIVLNHLGQEMSRICDSKPLRPENDLGEFLPFKIRIGFHSGRLKKMH